MSDGEKTLYCEVILRAWLDFIAEKPGHRDTIAAWRKYTREARLFLTQKHGSWAQSRHDICNAAGIDPEMLRTRALDYSPAH